ncbi:UNVERIFIED_CONTAM: hypothetical protein FKN15_047045 [Acipenser sinensis]
MQGGLTPSLLSHTTHYLTYPPPCLYKTHGHSTATSSPKTQPPTLESTNVHFRPLPRANSRVDRSTSRPSQVGTTHRRRGDPTVCQGRPERQPGHWRLQQRAEVCSWDPVQRRPLTQGERSSDQGELKRRLGTAQRRLGAWEERSREPGAEL